jgi:hypothetical protein
MVCNSGSAAIAHNLLKQTENRLLKKKTQAHEKKPQEIYFLCGFSPFKGAFETAPLYYNHVVFSL